MTHRTSRRMSVILVATWTVLSLWLACTVDLSGGSSTIGNPERVCGRVVTADQVPVGGMAVALVPVDYNPLSGDQPMMAAAKMQAAAGVHFDTTDSDGRFVFEQVDDGEYNLVAVLQLFTQSLYLPHITVADEDVDLGDVALQPAATLVVVVADSSYVPGAHLIIPGTMIAVPVTDAGVQVFAAVVGDISVQYVLPDSAALVTHDSLTTAEGDTLVVGSDTLPHWVIPPDLSDLPPITSLPPVITVHGARSSRGDPLQFQFSITGVEPQPWIDDSVAVLDDSVASGGRWITVRARSRLDTSVVSPWPDTVPIAVQMIAGPTSVSLVRADSLPAVGDRVEHCDTLILLESDSTAVLHAVVVDVRDRVQSHLSSPLWKSGDTTVVKINAGSPAAATATIRRAGAAGGETRVRIDSVNPPMHVRTCLVIVEPKHEYLIDTGFAVIDLGTGSTTLVSLVQQLDGSTYASINPGVPTYAGKVVTGYFAIDSGMFIVSSHLRDTVPEWWATLTVEVTEMCNNEPVESSSILVCALGGDTLAIGAGSSFTCRIPPTHMYCITSALAYRTDTTACERVADGVYVARVDLMADDYGPGGLHLRISDKQDTPLTGVMVFGHIVGLQRLLSVSGTDGWAYVQSGGINADCYGTGTHTFLLWAPGYRLDSLVWTVQSMHDTAYAALDTVATGRHVVCGRAVDSTGQGVGDIFVRLAIDGLDLHTRTLGGLTDSSGQFCISYPYTSALPIALVEWAPYPLDPPTNPRYEYAAQLSLTDSSSWVTIYTDGRPLPESYRRDAFLMAVNYLNAMDRPEADSVYPPPALVDTMTELLGAICSELDNAARDSVFDLDIHIYHGCVEGAELLLDTSYQWVRDYMATDTVGEPLLRSLLQTYGLHAGPAGIRDLGGFVSMMVRSDSMVNESALAAKLQNVSGVDLALPCVKPGDGDNIVAAEGPGVWDVTFTHKWGDCPAGCIYSHSWLFRVYLTKPMLRIFVGSEGDPL